MTVLVVGDANADLSVGTARFPREGDDALVSGLGWCSGGSAANVAVALARLGTSARLLARVGHDPAAELALRAAAEAGVDLSAIQRDPATATGLCIAVVSANGERTLFSFRGANVALQPPDSSDDLLADVRWLHIGGHALLDDPQRATALALLDAAHAARIPISLDLCLPLLAARADETRTLLPRLAILFANERELDALLPNATPQQALAAIVEAGCALAAAKLGAEGCRLAWAGGTYAAPAVPVAALDTTGCGDAFVAGLLHARLAGFDPVAQAAFGNAAGALAATRPGAADALPTGAEVRALLRNTPS